MANDWILLMDFVNQIILGDCLEVMKEISDHSVDLILCDLPYGTTKCKWDVCIPFDSLWPEYKRLIKDNGAIVLFGSQPFTSLLVCSNIEMFKYSWVWEKNRATGHVHSKNKPMKLHEDICVFSHGNTLHKGQSMNRMNYYPQNLILCPEGTKRRTLHDLGDGTVLEKRKSHKQTLWTHTNYPVSILRFDIEMKRKRYHPTQKPVELCEYLIKTYTQENEVVLDNCAGSGTTGIACKNINRQFILIEKEKEYAEIISKRLNQQYIMF